MTNMKDALEFHLEALEEFPKAKGLKYYLENGSFDEGAIDENFIIVQLEVALPAMV